MNDQDGCKSLGSTNLLAAQALSPSVFSGKKGEGHRQGRSIASCNKGEHKKEI